MYTNNKARGSTYTKEPNNIQECVPKPVLDLIQSTPNGGPHRGLYNYPNIGVLGLDQLEAPGTITL